jgi:hypothetical protein
MPQSGELYITNVPDYGLDTTPVIVILSCQESLIGYVINWEFYKTKEHRSRSWNVKKEQFHREWRLLSPVEKEMYEI